jgi:DNA polymerase
VVFAKGNPLAELVMFGEGPGQDEDEQGYPFVGKAGKLLARALEAIGHDERNTYFLNTVKCRAYDPQESGWGKNRAPYQDELEACHDHTARQLRALPNKKLVFALGSTALHWLLGAEPATIRIGNVRQKFLTIGLGLVPGLVTYHPSYLLRPEHAEEKGKVYEDFKLAKKLLDGHVDVANIRLHAKHDFLNVDWRELNKPEPRPWVPAAEDEQRPGKPLPSQVDRYTTALWIGDDQGETPAQSMIPTGATRLQFGSKPKKASKEPELVEAPGDLWFNNDDIPF